MKSTVKESNFEQQSKVVGFAEVNVVALNPNRQQLNKLLNRDDADDDKEIEYVSEKDGVDRVRLSFWLREVKTGRLFSHNILLSKQNKTNQDATKVQIVNQTGTTTWVPFIVENEEVTENPDYSVLPKWFTEFQMKDEGKEPLKLADKKYRIAYSGEEDLTTFLLGWTKFNPFPQNSVQAEETVLIEDVEKLFIGNVKELSSIIGSDFDKSFVVLAGVRTNPDDADKQYQVIWNKGFLPANFIKYINNGCNFPTDYTKKVWKRFTDGVSGEYGFQAFYKLEPMTDYNKDEDISTSPETSPSELAY